MELHATTPRAECDSLCSEHSSMESRQKSGREQNRRSITQCLRHGAPLLRQSKPCIFPPRLKLSDFRAPGAIFRPTSRASPTSILMPGIAGEPLAARLSHMDEPCTVEHRVPERWPRREASPERDVREPASVSCLGHFVKSSPVQLRFAARALVPSCQAPSN